MSADSGCVAREENVLSVHKCITYLFIIAEWPALLSVEGFRFTCEIVSSMEFSLCNGLGTVWQAVQ